MNQQLLRLLKLFGVAISLWLFTLPVGAQEMTFMERPFDPATDQAQLLPADQKGSVSWTAATRTLTLRDVQINTVSRILTGWMPNEITIQVEGTNQIVCTGSDDAITMRSSVRITGPGSLSITSEQAYAYACRSGASLTIADGVSVTAIGLNGGLVGDFVSSHLLIDKAYVTASTINDQGAVSIGYFKELTLEGCAITSPSGAKVAELNEVMSITLDGKEEYAGKVIIAPQQSYHKVTIAQAEHGRIVAPEGVDLTHLLAGSAVTFTAEPEDGYALTKLMAGTEDITNTRTLIVKADVTVTPTFSPVKSYRVSLQKPEHGTLTVKEQEYDLTKIPEGAILHFICTPEKGYELEHLMAGDQDITAEKYILEDRYFFIDGYNVRVEATFTRVGNSNAVSSPVGETCYTVEVSSDHLTITGASAGTPITLYTRLGETIFTTVATGASTEQIDLASTPSGLYLLTIGETTLKLSL